MKTAKPLLILLITCLIGLILARLVAIHVRQHLLLITPKIKMKTILTILLVLTVFASSAQKRKHAKVPDSLMQFNPTKHKLKCTSCAIQVKRYFDYTTKFTTTDSCNGSSHGTNSWLHSASPTFDDIKYLTAKWIYPKKLKDFSVLSIKEIQATDTLKWGEPFQCQRIERITFFNDTAKPTFPQLYNWTAKSDTVKCLMYLVPKQKRDWERLNNWVDGYVIMPGNGIHSLYNNITWMGDYIPTAIGPFSNIFLSPNKKERITEDWVIQVTLLK